MKASAVAAVAALSQTVSAHYIWTALNANTNAVRQPVDNSPVTSPTASNYICNTNTGAGSEILSLAAGSQITWTLDNTLYHLGPAAIYMGKVPSGETAATWDGTDATWFKIAQWGATYPDGVDSAMSFADYNDSALSATLPTDIENGDYLIKIEQIALHVVDAPQWYTSCGQVTITGGSGATQTSVSMPPYTATDPGLTVDIYDVPAPSPYVVPGPAPIS